LTVISIVNHLTRPANARRRTIVVAAALIAPLASAGIAAPALAKSPTGDFAVFSQCPRFTSGVTLCLYSRTKSGEVTLGKQTVPVSKTITLQGGIVRNEETEAETFVGALNGETMSKTPEPVPGGLLGLIKCSEIKGTGSLEKAARAACEATLEKSGQSGVNAVTELADPAGDIQIDKNNLVNREAVALSLPVKIHLENPLLGSACYIGSSTSPITWNFTTGTTSPPAPNKPISGKVGPIVEKDEGELIELPSATLVDNAFSTPAASGCGGALSVILDPLIDEKIGLPSAAGYNTAILNNRIEMASAERVLESE
jgi:hypothetical protein